MLESFNTHLLTNTPKGVIRIHKSKKGKQEMAKKKRTNNAMVKRKRNEKIIVIIILHETLNMEHNEPTTIWGLLSCSQCVGYSCSSRGTRRITNVVNLVISHTRWQVMSEARMMGLYNYKKWRFLFVILPLSIIKLYIEIYY
jgi:hypothetical protein